MKKTVCLFLLIVSAMLMSVACYAITLDDEASIVTDGKMVYYIEKNANSADVLCSASLNGRERREIYSANNLDIRGISGHYIWMYSFDNKDLSVGHDANVVVVDASTGLDTTVARDNYITCYSDAIYLYPWGKEAYNSLYYCSPDGTDIQLVTTANQKTFTLFNNKLYYIESDGTNCRVMVSDKNGQNPQQLYDWFGAKSIYQLTAEYVEYGDAANNIYRKFFADDRLKFMDEGSYANFCFDDGGNLYYHDFSKFFVLTKSGEVVYLDNMDAINNATILGIVDGNIYYMTDNKINVKSYEIFNAQQLADFDKAAENAKTKDEVSVYLNGNKLDFTQPPVIVNGTTLVPMKAIFEAMGATITWDANTKTVYANCNGKTLEMTVGKDYAILDGEVLSILTPAQIVNGYTMVPVRIIAQSFGVEPGWDEATRSVTINK